jgi:hypothetical protein
MSCCCDARFPLPARIAMGVKAKMTAMLAMAWPFRSGHDPQRRRVAIVSSNDDPIGRQGEHR